MAGYSGCTRLSKRKLTNRRAGRRLGERSSCRSTKQQNALATLIGAPLASPARTMSPARAVEEHQPCACCARAFATLTTRTHTRTHTHTHRAPACAPRDRAHGAVDLLASVWSCRTPLPLHRKSKCCTGPAKNTIVCWLCAGQTIPLSLELTARACRTSRAGQPWCRVCRQDRQDKRAKA